MSSIFSSSIGRKLIMSLAGLFLITFLVVHLIINLLLVFSDSSDAFNVAANFMGTNPVIRVMEIVLFGGFILHMLYGVIIQIRNWMSRGSIGYKKENHSQTSFFSKYMFHSAMVVTVFLVIHIANFYVKARFLGQTDEVIVDGQHVHDLGALVVELFQLPGYVIFYVISLFFLAFHLHHGFQSAFQTLGINHKTYSPFIKKLGIAYTVLVTAGFMYIPLYIYFTYA